MSEIKCPKCDGCGQIADDEDQTPWKFWQELPAKSAAAVFLGLVKPIVCPACKGTGTEDDSMKSAAEIRAEIAVVEGDERLHYNTATVFENAPLALIQLGLETKRDTLYWMLGENPPPIKNQLKTKKGITQCRR